MTAHRARKVAAVVALACLGAGCSQHDKHREADAEFCTVLRAAMVSGLDGPHALTVLAAHSNGVTPELYLATRAFLSATSPYRAEAADGTYINNRCDAVDTPLSRGTSPATAVR